MDLLSKSNTCGRTLLTIVSRGSSIIAEIQRLRMYIPTDFTFPKEEITNPYAKILYSYEYFGHEDEAEEVIEHDPRLNEINDELRETHIEIVDRFCHLFESIVRYAFDFQHFIEQINQNVFLQISLESLLTDTDGKQLLGEALYLYGVILLQMDLHIPGIVRERLLVAFHRWRGPAMLRNYSKVCEVCRSSGFVRGHSYPPGYPVDFLNRIQFPKEYISLLIGRYRNDDIYVQMPNYPDTEHRAVALASQAQMLFVFLFFAPDILNNEEYVMREIVDKFFFDNWDVPYFMGFVFELPTVWFPFKAANAAISQTLKLNAARYFQRASEQLQTNHQKIKDILSEGFTKTETLLDNINAYVKLVRDSNVVLRFMTLHSQPPSKKAQFPLEKDDLLAYLLDMAQFEFELKAALDKALKTKTELWDSEKTKAQNLLNELAVSFGGALSSIQKDEQLQKWFENMSKEVSTIENAQSSIQKIFQLSAALEKVMQFHQISGAIFIKESVGRVIQSLKTLSRLLNIDEKYVPLIGTLSDFSYGFAMVNTLVPLMQTRIKADPFSVLKLRATFLKMTSLLDLQLMRIIQAESGDVESVSEHYSSLIVDFVRGVLEIVPVSIFAVLDEIIELRTNVIKDLPSKIERAKLKQFAQLEERANLASLTKEVSILTSGILAMKTTLMGVITVDPKQMLEEGIRKQLVKKIISVLYANLVPTKPVSFQAMIEGVGRSLDGIRSSFEYMGDYVNIDGLRIWHHEYSRIMCFLVEQESNRFLKKKVMGWQSDFQSEVAPIEIPDLGGKATTCIGLLTLSIIEMSQRSAYCAIVGGWLNIKTGEEVLGTKTIDKLCNALGIEGASSIDSLLSFHLAKNLRSFFDESTNGKFYSLSSLMNRLLDAWPSPMSSYDEYNDLFGKVKPIADDFTRTVCSIGQIQLLKATINSHMKLRCKLEAQSLEFILDSTNDTVLQAIKQFYRDPTHNPYPSSKLLCALSTYLENCGICEPYEKIYSVSPSLPEVSLVLFAISIMNINATRLKEDERLRMLVSTDTYSHYEFIVGTITILRQMNSSHLYSFLSFMGQYANLMLAQPPALAKKENNGGVEVIRPLRNLMIFMKDFEELSKSPRRMVDTFISPAIYDFLSI